MDNNLTHNADDKTLAAQSPEIHGLACVLFKAAFENSDRKDLDFTDPAPIYLRQAVVLCGNEALRTEALGHLLEELGPNWEIHS
jgi:hypothetical protein